MRLSWCACVFFTVFNAMLYSLLIFFFINLLTVTITIDCIADMDRVSDITTKNLSAIFKIKRTTKKTVFYCVRFEIVKAEDMIGIGKFLFTIYLMQMPHFIAIPVDCLRFFLLSFCRPSFWLGKKGESIHFYYQLKFMSIFRCSSIALTNHDLTLFHLLTTYFSWTNTTTK